MKFLPFVTFLCLKSPGTYRMWRLHQVQPRRRIFVPNPAVSGKFGDRRPLCLHPREVCFFKDKVECAKQTQRKCLSQMRCLEKCDIVNHPVAEAGSGGWQRPSHRFVRITWRGLLLQGDLYFPRLPRGVQRTFRDFYVQARIFRKPNCFLCGAKNK